MELFMLKIARAAALVLASKFQSLVACHRPLSGPAIPRSLSAASNTLQ